MTSIHSNNELILHNLTQINLSNATDRNSPQLPTINREQPNRSVALISLPKYQSIKAILKAQILVQRQLRNFSIFQQISNLQLVFEKNNKIVSPWLDMLDVYKLDFCFFKYRNPVFFLVLQVNY